MRAIIHRAYVCYSAATRPSCQITLGRLVEMTSKVSHQRRLGSISTVIVDFEI